jgi:hydroxylamine dehydrogenase
MAMNIKIFTFLFIAFVFVSCIANAQAISDKPKTSSETEDCISCHENVTPGIVADWRTSLHSQNSFATASLKPDLEKRVSSSNVPKQLKDIVVGCYECHSLNADKHKDNFDHFGYKINIIVTPNDCNTCHTTEVSEYLTSKKAHALENLRDNPVYSALVNTTLGVKEISNNKINSLDATHYTKNEACYACHGTEIKVDGTRKISTDLGEIEIPKLTDWPNQGVGRINPDGSIGSCTACHPRHNFSIEIARQPHTCEQCHLEPDVPAYNIYIESKHGNIFESKKEKWNWEEVPWKLGTDFTAPSCATCHNSLLVNSQGEMIANRSHDFGSRLWVRIFGLIYSHPQPKSGKTYEIKNQDGLPLPTTFNDLIANDYLISKKEQDDRKEKMMGICFSCHGNNWVTSHFEKMDNTIKETDKMVASATNLISYAWKENLADNKNPFDEDIEQMWIQQWLFYANSVRYSSAMSGPDYAAFKNGWWYLTKNLNDINQIINQLKKKQ